LVFFLCFGFGCVVFRKSVHVAIDYRNHNRRSLLGLPIKK
jgi:hypothetical protein